MHIADGPDSYDEASEFIQNQFIRNQGAQEVRRVYVHFATTIDRERVQLQMGAIRDVLMPHRWNDHWDGLL